MSPRSTTFRLPTKKDALLELDYVRQRFRAQRRRGYEKISDRSHGGMNAGDILQQAVVMEQERTLAKASRTDVLPYDQPDLLQMSATLREIAGKIHWVKSMVSKHGLKCIDDGLLSQESKDQLVMIMADQSRRDRTNLRATQARRVDTVFGYKTEESMVGHKTEESKVTDKITETLGRMQLSNQAEPERTITKYRTTPTGKQRYCTTCKKWISNIQFEIHTGGNKHAKKAKTNVPVMVDCLICDRTVGVLQLEEHKQGNAHRAAEQRMYEYPLMVQEQIRREGWKNVNQQILLYMTDGDGTQHPHVCFCGFSMRKHQGVHNTFFACANDDFPETFPSPHPCQYETRSEGNVACNVRAYKRCTCKPRPAAMTSGYPMDKCTDLSQRLPDEPDMTIKGRRTWILPKTRAVRNKNDKTTSKLPSVTVRRGGRGIRIRGHTVNGEREENMDKLNRTKEKNGTHMQIRDKKKTAQKTSPYINLLRKTQKKLKIFFIIIKIKK